MEKNTDTLEVNTHKETDFTLKVGVYDTPVIPYMDDHQRIDSKEQCLVTLNKNGDVQDLVAITKTATGALIEVFANGYDEAPTHAFNIPCTLD